MSPKEENINDGTFTKNIYEEQSNKLGGVLDSDKIERLVTIVKKQKEIINLQAEIIALFLYMDIKE